MLKNCTVTLLENGSLLFEDVSTPHGVAEQVFLSGGGLYAIVSDCEDPAALFDYFRTLLGMSRVRLYFVGKGEYDPALASFSGEISDDELNDVISGYFDKVPQQYSPSALERMKSVLLKSDARSRGYYTNEDGTSYVFRHGEFRRASEVNPELVFKLCLYGGVFGLHRFALGKWLTGLIYIFTCGLFLFGWLCDLIQLFFGAQKDKHKNFVRPISDRRHKLRSLPIGLVISIAALVFWQMMFQLPISLPSASLGVNLPVIFSVL